MSAHDTPQELDAQIAQQAGAETLCRIYFDIAASAVGEEAVRRQRDEAIQRIDSTQKTWQVVPVEPTEAMRTAHDISRCRSGKARGPFHCCPSPAVAVHRAPRAEAKHAVEECSVP